MDGINEALALKAMHGPVRIEPILSRVDCRVGKKMKDWNEASWEMVCSFSNIYVTEAVLATI